MVDVRPDEVSAILRQQLAGLHDFADIHGDVAHAPRRGGADQIAAPCFNDADAVIVADVYSAGEQPIKDIDRDHLVMGIRARGHRNVAPLPSSEQLATMIHGIAKPGDMVVCLGAGSITQWAYALPGELKALG